METIAGSGSAPQPPASVTNPYFTPGFLRGFIGKTMRVEFTLGTEGAVSDRVGRLTDVGVDYIVLRDAFTGADIVADLFSVRFITIFPETAP